MNSVRYLGVLLVVLGLLLAPGRSTSADESISDGPASVPLASPRLIVELDSPPLSVALPALAQTETSAPGLQSSLAQSYIDALEAEQAAFATNLQRALPGARVSTFTNEFGTTELNSYQVLFNGMAIHLGSASKDEAMRTIARLPGVKGVYPDLPHASDLYTSTNLINAPQLWAALGGREQAGAGIKVASMDGGVHHLAAMMNGTGYRYPDGYGPAGLGLSSNNNGKIIASRVYFRDWDPPIPADANPWPGFGGTSHGMHTSSTAAGGIVENATISGLNIGRISGVAPNAYVMSYRVFYNSVNGIESFYTAEGLAALEDIVRDGADVVNNSWGGGPISEGGMYDPLDQALINAWNAGVFVSMSAGNAGPGNGTTDHPSQEYIVVAASTTPGTLASGRLTTTISDTVKNAAFAGASFGTPLPPAQVLEYPYLPALTADPANVEGCQPWPAGTFIGKAALISRGTCEFGVKVLNAQQAGATFVVVYNSAAGGEGLINMGPGAVGNQVTISSLFVGRTAGLGLLNHFAQVGANSARFQVNTLAFQAGNIADRIINFSSRGPGVGNVLKPDIAAPGVNIVAQGYDETTTGEAAHLGYGQSSGTSMASPHVAGAAALVKQAYPNWPNWAVKSALMSTAKYLEVYNFDETPAQPLDMGAGRLDLQNVLDPGVILNPQSLSFGLVPTGTQKSLLVTVQSVANATETYTIGTIWTGAGFAPTQTTTVPGMTFTPASLTLNPGETKTFTVTFNPANGRGYGDNQGYLTLDGPVHDAHLAAWARVTPNQQLANVLLIDNDGSFAGFPDYSWYYTTTLTRLGMTYNLLELGPGVDLPSVAEMLGYQTVVWFTGENYAVSLGLSLVQQDRMVDYLNSGGRLIAMGQDLSSTLGEATPENCSEFFYCYRLGAVFVQDSISNNQTPMEPVIAAHTAPAALRGLSLDLSVPRSYNASGSLTGGSEVPPVVSPAGGTFAVNYNVDQARLTYNVTVTSTQEVTVTGVFIHDADAGANGPVVRVLTTAPFTPTVVSPTTALNLSGVINPPLTVTEVETLLSNGFYINVHTTQNPAGEVRGQIEPEPYTGQVSYIDELTNAQPTDNPNPEIPGSGDSIQSTPLFMYGGQNNQDQGIVAMAYDDQIALERSGITYRGRSAYLAFGLEGLRPSAPTLGSASLTSADDLLGTLMTWLEAAPGTATVSQTAAISSTGTAIFTASYTSTTTGATPVEYRWDFGDESLYTTSLSSTAGHVYQCSEEGNTHTVRVEVTDRMGMVAIASRTIDASSICTTPQNRVFPVYLPVMRIGG